MFIAAATMAAVLALSPLASPAHASTTSGACLAKSPGASVSVDATCVDPAYSVPVIDSQSDVTQPSTVHLVQGHFDGTNVSFRIYLPAKDEWRNRFFQFTYPLDGQEPLNSVAFATSHGGYSVQTSGAAGYRHAAAAAKFARTVAANYYGVDSAGIFGYLYGWSGGAFQVDGALEYTTGVWQGAVPIVQGSPLSVIHNFSVRALATFVLKDKKDQIEAAERPGGSGNPYAGLSPMQASVLKEATRMGIPLKAWEDFDYLATTVAFDGFVTLVPQIDSTYVDDFWSKPGYLGTEHSALGTFFRQSVAKDPSLRARLALMAYHRYTIPSTGFGAAYDQFRTFNGTPAFPQRSMNVARIISSSITGGASFSGALNVKTIAVNSTIDADAYPWEGAWYAKQVQSALGAAVDSRFRVWFTENADHNPENRTGAGADRLVGYAPVVYRALDDLTAWVERDVAPAKSSSYRVTQDNQVLLSDSINRGGVQPLVELTALAAAKRHDVRVGKSVTFSARVQVPRGTGSIVSIGWDPQGYGSFRELKIPSGSTTLVLHLSARYGTAGTYYPTVRVGAQRDGDKSQVLTTVLNLDRTDVVVR
ncbi:hypothetical protein [Curtobacterium sp. UNCCL20]|uniref:hypothetical protein n=1 Tax=Curtobacterium sp. UNCCL20 TaxID=1502773 RepID=UPI001C31939F|nr:hypothetical protein [Curtobacterium sp. UNCCL20]